MAIWLLPLNAEQREALARAASQRLGHLEDCGMWFPKACASLTRRAQALEEVLALLQAQPANAGAGIADPAVLQPVLLALGKALRAAAAHAELFTDRCVQVQPPAWAIKPDGDCDPGKIATTARAALALLDGPLSC